VSTILLRPRFVRRLPDPFYNSTHGTERHIFFIAVADVPNGISLEPAPRNPKVRWDVYKDVQSSLLDVDCTPGTFHLKNSGITVVARDVRKVDDDEYEIKLGSGHGIINGALTYRLICDALRDPDLDIPKQQFVKIEVLTRVPDEWIGEISSGLNTSMQGQAESLAALGDALAWLRSDLKNEPYFDSIAWTENERGDCNVQDILCALTCFNTVSYPNTGSVHPVATYEKKSVVLSSFAEDYKTNGGRSYRRLRPIIKDILTLHDTIQLEFPKLCENVEQDAPELVEHAKKSPYEFAFLQARSTERLARGALYPILAAYRWMVEDDPDADTVRWRGGFDNVVKRWRDTGARLIAQTVDKSREVGHNPDAIGKSPSHWGALHKEVAFVDLMAQQSAPEPEKPPAAQAG
jgi:hypothetical protein